MTRRLLFSRRQTITPIGDRLDIYVVHLLSDPSWLYRFGLGKQISQLEEKKKWN